MSRLDDAIDELYGADLDQFVLRRKQLAVDAKAAGDKDAAAAILALRKPTQSAFTVNRLSRTDGHAIDELMELGTELQHAQRGADAATLRELNRRRRALLSELTTRAFDVIGQQSPTTGQREEVSATLQAALADPDLAAQLRAGRLVKAAESSGFGFSPPDLTLLLSPAPQRPDAGAPGDRSSPPPPRRSLLPHRRQPSTTAPRRPSARQRPARKPARW